MGLKDNFDFVDFSYERDFNLLYAEIKTKTGITKRRKEIQKDRISNLAIYEIEHEKLSYFLILGR